MVAEAEGAVGGYRFSHSLVREVLYEQLPLPVRVQLHRRVGETIEALYGTGSSAPVAELARHFAEVAAAGEAGKALAYARRAGERAMDMHAYEQAAAEYQRALGAWGYAGGDDTDGCELLLRLGAAQARAGDYPPRRGELPAGRGDQQEAWSARAAGTRRPGLGRTSGRGRHRQPAARGATRGGTPGPGNRGFAASRPAVGPALPGAHLLGQDRPHEGAQRRGGRHGPSAGRPGGATHSARYPLDGGVGPGWAGGAHRAGRRGAATGTGDRRPGDGAGRSRHPGGHLARVR